MKSKPKFLWTWNVLLPGRYVLNSVFALFLVLGTSNPISSQSSCDDNLLQYGFGEECDNVNNLFEPQVLENCILAATDLLSLSCAEGLLCIPSTAGEFQFSFTAGGLMSISHVRMNLLYPINMPTAGGEPNSKSCQGEFTYIVKVYKNGELLHTMEGIISADEFTLVEVFLPMPELLEEGDDVMVLVDGITEDTACDLIELEGLSVHGCCIVCPIDFVEAMPSDTICLGESVMLTANISEGTPPYTFNWTPAETLDDPTAQTTTATPAETTTYSVEVVDHIGCMDTAEVTVYVEDAPEPPYAKDISICPGESTSLIAKGCDGIVFWYYEEENGNMAHIGAHFDTPNLDSTTTYWISCSVGDCESPRVPVTVYVPGNPTCEIAGQSDVSCNGGSDGSFVFFVEGGVAAYDYEVQSGDQIISFGAIGTEGETLTVEGLSAGDYTIVITDQIGCVTTCEVSIGEPEVLECNITQSTDVSCAGGSDGSVQFNIQGGTAEYQYEITLNEGGSTISSGTVANDDVTGIIEGLAAGVYTIQITDANGCNTHCIIEIEEPDELTCNISEISHVNCNGGQNGSFKLTVGGGTSGYSYTLSSDGEIVGSGMIDEDGGMDILASLPAGTYVVEISDANACMVSCEVEITEPEIMTCTLLNTEHVSCDEGFNGSIQFQVNGGTPGYFYEIIEVFSNQTIKSGSIPTDGQILTVGDLPASIYVVRISDSKGCTSSCATEVLEPSNVLCEVLSATDASCLGDDDGAFSFDVNGGSNSYTYEVTKDGELISSGMAMNNMEIAISDLIAGSYLIDIVDESGCTTSCHVDISEPELLSCDVFESGDVSCNGETDGGFSFGVSGGTGDYYYEVSLDGQPTGSGTIGMGMDMTMELNGLAAGSYTIDITDANGCTATCGVDVTEPDALVCNISNPTNVSCSGEKDGAFSFEIEGGTLNYNYVVIKGDGQVCASGSIDSDGVITDIGGLAAGTYTVSVTDDNGCLTSCELEILEPEPLVCEVLESNDASCFGSSDGSFSFEVTGGTLDIDYVASIAGETAASGTISAESGSGTISGLMAGVYDIQITDGNGCRTSCQVEIGQPEELGCQVTDFMDLTCNDSNDGSFVFEVSGGTTAYYYEVRLDGQVTGSGTIGVNTGSGTLSGLGAGNYVIEIEDANGCMSSCEIELTEPEVLSCVVSETTDVSCKDGSDGSLVFQASGGTLNYSYSVSIEGTIVATGKISSEGSDNKVFGLSAGSYLVEIIDANGCTTTCEALIGEPDELVCTILNIADVNCNAGSDGSFILSVSGGTPSYDYDVKYGGETMASGSIDSDGETEEVSGLTSGTYTVYITDSNGCETSCVIRIDEPNSLLCEVNGSTDASCNGGSDGSFSFEVTGGTQEYTYEITLEGEFTGSGTIGVDMGTESIMGLSAGNYLISVTDQNGCTTTCDAIVGEPDALVCEIVEANAVGCTGGADGSLIFAVTGGTTNYSYVVTKAGEPCASGIISSDGGMQMVNGLSAGSYLIEIIDAQGCITSCAAEIDEPEPLVCNIVDQTDVSCNGGDDGSFAFDLTGGSSVYSFLITKDGEELTSGMMDGEGFSYMIDGLGAGTYSVEITDMNGCSTSCGTVISEPDALSCTISGEINTSCNGGSDGSFELSAGGGTEGYTYGIMIGDSLVTTGSIESDGGSEFIQGLSAGTYTIQVTDANGCSSTCEGVIEEPQALICTVDDIQNTSCNGSADGSFTFETTGGTLISYYEVSLSGEIIASGKISAEGQIRPIAGLIAGTYVVDIVDSNGCTTSCEATIEEPDVLVCETTNLNNVSCSGEADGSIDFTVSGGTAIYLYEIWSEGQLISSGMIENDGGMDNVDGLTAGSYSVHISDANGCISVCEVEITEPLQLVCSITSSSEVSCSSGDDGMFSFSVSGGTAGYDYAVSLDGESVTSGNLSESGDAVDVSGLTAGTYEIEITDENGCTTSCEVEIGEPPAYTLDLVCGVEPELGVSGSSEGCDICTDEPINLQSNVAGGTAPYQYSWSNNAIGPMISVSPDSTTSYSVTVTDANGCEIVDSITITVVPCDTLHHQKEFISAETLDDGTYDVRYMIQVINDGAGPGLYDLLDVPYFDDDIDILSASYSSDVSGNESGDLDAGDLPWTLSSNQQIEVSETHTYYVLVNVGLNLTDGSGDNVYTACGEGTEGIDRDQALYNESMLDINSDGEIDEVDNACGDLPAEIGNFVWEDLNGNGLQDEDEPGVENVDVSIVLANGGKVVDASGDDVGPVSTDSEGNYGFGNLVPGDYKVVFKSPDGYAFTVEDVTGANEGSNDTDMDSDADPVSGETEVYTLNAGGLETKADAGLVQAAQIGDMVWSDVNVNGLMDEGEPGISRVTVTLQDCEGNSVTNVYGDEVSPQITGTSGKYLFTNLYPGIYRVAFEAPEDYIHTTANASGAVGDDGDDNMDSDADEVEGISHCVELTSGEVDDRVDAGFYQLACVGDMVWMDTNCNGFQDSNEGGLNGVTLILYADADMDGIPDGEAMQETVTTYNEVWDEDGFYQFCVVPGSYVIEVIISDEFELSPVFATSDSHTDSNADPETGLTSTITVLSGAQNNSIDVLVKDRIPIPCIGDYVWRDKNLNGIQDSNESGVNGIKIQLYLDENEDGIRDGGPIDWTYSNYHPETGKKGFYQFCDMPPGKYILGFERFSVFVRTKQNAGDNDDIDSDPDPWTGYTETIMFMGDLIDNIDGGYFLNNKLGYQVWRDNNNDHILNEGDEFVPGVKVNIYRKVGGEDIFIGSTVTDQNGQYEFDNLGAGDYRLQFELPEGFTFVDAQSGIDKNADSDVLDVNTGTTGYYSISSDEEVLNIDAGIRLSPGADQEFAAVEVYPVPTTDQVTIDIQHGTQQDVKIQLYDSAGKLVTREYELIDKNSTSSTMVMSLGDLSRGFYFMKVAVGDQLFTKKINLIQ